MNNRNKIIIILAIILSLLTSFSGVSFAQPVDIQGHWAEKQINDWLINGLAKGYQDNTFKPDSSISRAEFATLANNALGYKEVKEIHYSDVPSSAWFAGEIAKAAGAGYLSGYGDGTVKPDAKVSRQEVAAMLAKILKLDSTADINAAGKFNDAAGIPEWSRGAIGAVTASGYMLGYPDGTFQPEKQITRAEAVVALNKARAARVETTDNSVTYDKSGIFGPAGGNETVKGNVYITAAGVTLRNVTITGDLLLGESIGDGEVTLNNVTVQGQTIIKGGGSHSVTLDGCTLPYMVVEKEGVRVVSSGNTRVNMVRLESGAILVEASLTGPGFEKVTLSETIPADAAVKLDGNFTNVNVNTEKVKLEVAGGAIASLEVAKEAAGASIDIAQNAKVTNMTLNAAVSVKGKGVVETARVNVSGSTFEQKPNNVDKADDVSVNIGNTGTPTGSGPGNGSGGGDGNNPLNLLGAYLVSNGERIGATEVPVNPEIKLVFDRGVVRDNWDNNQQCISLKTLSGTEVPIDVSRIEGVESEKRHIYISPITDLTSGTTYKIIISASLKANNGNTLGSEKTVTFTVKSAGGGGGSGGGVSKAPTFVSSEVTAQGDVSVTFNKDMEDTASLAGKERQFTVSVDGNPVAISALSRTSTATKIKLTLSTKVTSGSQAVTVSYAKDADPAKQVKSVDGGVLESFDPQNVTNELPGASPAYQSSEVTSQGDVSVTFNKEMEDTASLVGKEGQFTVSVDGTPVVVSALSLTSTVTKIKITLATKVTSGSQAVTVSYTKDADPAKQVKSSDGGVLESFDPQNVTNELPGSSPAYQSSEVTSQGDVSVTFNKEMEDTAFLAGKEGQFTVSVDGNPVVISALSRTSTTTKIKLTLATKVTRGSQAVTVSYTKDVDPAKQVKSSDGGVLESFDAQDVTNDLPVTPPTFQSSEVTSQGDVSVTFSKNMESTDSLAGKESQFIVIIDGNPVDISGISLTKTPNKIKLSLASIVTSGSQAVTISYTKDPDPAKQVKSADGGVLESFDVQDVTNDLP